MKLYKYLSGEIFEKYLGSHLKGEVYVSAWREFNDPMEGFFIYIARHDTQHIVEAVVGQKSEYRVCCFFKTYKEFLLWSYYANKHKGVCLEYNIQEPPPECMLEAVQYSHTLPQLDTTASVDEQVKRFLLTKMDPWRHEQEVRLLARKVSCRTIPFGRLTGIIFGVNFADGNPRDTLRQQVASTVRGFGESGPKLYQAVIEGDSPKITRQPIDTHEQSNIIYFR